MTMAANKQKLLLHIPNYHVTRAKGCQPNTMDFMEVILV